jgi:AcrR family transcriptional regulator
MNPFSRQQNDFCTAEPCALTVTSVSCNDRIMTERRSQLRDAALEYLVEHGAAKLSLRPLATKLGTSPRILMFHFRSKEGLILDVLEELSARLQASFKTLVPADPGPGRESPIRLFWKWAATEKNSRYLRLLYEVQIIAIQNPSEYGRYLKKVSLDWLETALQATSGPLRTESMGTLCIAVFDGLFLELMSTGDRKRLTKALNLFISIATKSVPAPGDKRRSSVHIG